MTPKYYAWLAQIDQRDDMLSKLALFAIGAVAAWEMLRFLPPGWAARLRTLYMLGGFLLLAIMAIVVYAGVTQ